MLRKARGMMRAHEPLQSYVSTTRGASRIKLKRSSSVCFAFVLLASAVSFVSAPAFAQGTISLTVDATKTPQKFIPCKEVSPVKPGPLTLYYPKWIPGEHSPSVPIVNVTGLTFSADGKTIPWRRDLTDVYTFHLDVPAGVDRLDADFDYLEP